MSKCLRRIHPRSSATEEPPSGTLGELNVTVIHLTGSDKIKFNVLRATIAAAVADEYEAMIVFASSLSEDNKALLREALAEHSLALWNPHTNTKVNI